MSETGWMRTPAWSMRPEVWLRVHTSVAWRRAIDNPFGFTRVPGGEIAQGRCANCPTGGRTSRPVDFFATHQTPLVLQHTIHSARQTVYGAMFASIVRLRNC